ncbi:lysophospholipid acyltransferase family protein [Aeromicrobium sp. CF4.19]|uniref:lysophospholipid acyltransferase family protein n=1 Tax=Aeromicrobium sp. CF4.19 TaxID=3373082 RepID=UPI003EE4DE49
MRSDRTYRVVVRIIGGIFRVLGVRFTVRGGEHLPRTGGAVVASNHISFIDFTVVGYAARDRGRLVRFMSKTSVFEVPVVGRLMRAMGHIPVDRWTGASAYRRARRLLAHGEVVGVFPEATISRSWRVKRLKPGAAGLALSRDVPLVPCVLWGAHRILTVDGRRSLRRGIPVTVLLGEPLVPRADETADELTDRLHEAMSTLLAEAVDAYPDVPRDDADRWWVPHDRGGTAPDVETAAALDREALRRIGAPGD